MSLQLQPGDLAACFTLIEINTEIAAIQAAISLARESKSDSFDDMQARQKVERVNITELNNELSVWIKAKNLKNETDSSTAELIAADFTGLHP